MRTGTTTSERQVLSTFGGGRAANQGQRRLRDSQKTKVYKAGWAAQRGTAGCGHVMPLHAVRVYASELWEAAGQPSATLPRITVSGRRSSSCTSSVAGISMAADMCTPQVISHELAHSLLRISQPELWLSSASHGPEFCRTWLNMLSGSKLAINKALATELVRQFDAHNVKVQRLTASAPVAITATVVPVTEAPVASWTATQELERRAANRPIKRNGGFKVEFPKGANPALFEASASDLREMR